MDLQLILQVTHLEFALITKLTKSNLGTSSSMKMRRGFNSGGLHFINSCRQLCTTLTGVTISAVLNPRSTLLIAVYRNAITCMQKIDLSGKQSYITSFGSLNLRVMFVLGFIKPGFINLLQTVHTS